MTGVSDGLPAVLPEWVTQKLLGVPAPLPPEISIDFTPSDGVIRKGQQPTPVPAEQLAAIDYLLEQGMSQTEIRKQLRHGAALITKRARMLGLVVDNTTTAAASKASRAAHGARRDAAVNLALTALVQNLLAQQSPASTPKVLHDGTVAWVKQARPDAAAQRAYAAAAKDAALTVKALTDAAGQTAGTLAAVDDFLASILDSA